ncbi:MAG: YceI family protein [Deltaproteobacteria bacterium]|nr:YceI family protein [Deltaproteobacteria bacterium]
MNFNRYSFTLVLVGAVALSACAKDPSKDAPAAKVEEPKKEEPKAEEPKVEAPAAATPVAAPAAASPTATGPALTFPGVALTGSIHATGSKVTGSHELNFKEWKGSFEAKDGKAEGGKLEFQVQMASLEEVVKERNEWVDKLEGHLKSPDFFDVAVQPTAAFVASEIKAGGDAAVAGTTHTIKGSLTLKGTTKEVTFPATIAVAGKDVTAKAEFSINRKDFGIVYAGKPDDLIRDGVVLKIDLKATLP